MKTLFVIDIKIYESAMVNEFPFNIRWNGKKFYNQTSDGAVFTPGYFQLFFDGDEAEIDKLHEWCRGKGWIKIIGVDTTEVPDLADVVKVALEKGEITAEESIIVMEQSGHIQGMTKLKEIIKPKQDGGVERNLDM